MEILSGFPVFQRNMGNPFRPGGCARKISNFSKINSFQATVSAFLEKSHTKMHTCRSTFGWNTRKCDDIHEDFFGVKRNKKTCAGNKKTCAFPHEKNQCGLRSGLSDVGNMNWIGGGGGSEKKGSSLL